MQTEHMDAQIALLNKNASAWTTLSIDRRINYLRALLKGTVASVMSRLQPLLSERRTARVNQAANYWPARWCRLGRSSPDGVTRQIRSEDRFSSSHHGSRNALMDRS